MYPLLPFAAGLLAGAVVTRLVKAERARMTLGKAQDRLRDATVSSLAAIEHSSAGLRSRLMHAGEAAAGEAAPAAPAKPSRAPRAARGAAASEAPAATRTAAAPKRAPRRTGAKAAKPAAAAKPETAGEEKT